MSLKKFKAEPIIRLNQPSINEIVNMLIDAHNNMRCGKVDEGRIVVEALLSEMVLNWKDVVNYPRQPSV